MAKASVTRNEVVVNLELSAEEAQFILDITGRIGGDPDNSRRKHSDSIGQALREIKELDTDYYAGDLEERSSLMFKDGGRTKGMRASY